MKEGFMKLFGMYGVILITQISCHSANYHQPKGVIEDLIPSEYQKTPFTQQNIEITKTVDFEKMYKEKKGN